ncbi:hypothetical protein N9K60_01180 [Candidatus Poseidoniales archaeon]|nr:hypothetical protein [Candidatus Poseidoniales archaeon]
MKHGRLFSALEINPPYLSKDDLINRVFLVTTMGYDMYSTLDEMSDDEKRIEAMSDEEKARHKAEQRWLYERMFVGFLYGFVAGFLVCGFLAFQLPQFP